MVQVKGFHLVVESPLQSRGAAECWLAPLPPVTITSGRCAGAVAGTGAVAPAQGSCTRRGAVDPVDQRRLDRARTSHAAGRPDCPLQPEAR